MVELSSPETPGRNMLGQLGGTAKSGSASEKSLSDRASAGGGTATGGPGAGLLRGVSTALGLSSNLAIANDYYFPPELVGGVAPRVKGQEREIAWHAAAEACDTERLSLVYQVSEEKVWFIASKTADLAMQPHSWCPFASLLPGMRDAQISPICYTYYSDEVAMMMTLTADMIQIHRGTSSVIRAKSERVARELGGGAIVELTPELVQQLTPQPWMSLNLYEDRMRRLLASLATIAGLCTAVGALAVWLVASFTLVVQQGDLALARQRALEKTDIIYQQLVRLRVSPIHNELEKFAVLNDRLVEVNGWLRLYQLQGPKAVWRAIVPPTMTGQQINELGAKSLGNVEQGVLVGTEGAPQ